jgi:hypothetical protein
MAPLFLVMTLGSICLATGLVCAQPPAGDLSGFPQSGFAEAEYELFGPAASDQWQSVPAIRYDQGNEAMMPSGPPSNMGRKFKAGLLSLLIPGLGQYHNGDNKKAYIFAGAEVAIWASYITFHIQANNREDTYQEWAGIYAGVSGEHPEKYWRAVGRYLDSDAYNESLRREARATGEETSRLITGDDVWQWRNEYRLRPA